jgi:hypothetical protein
MVKLKLRLLRKKQLIGAFFLFQVFGWTVNASLSDSLSYNLSLEDNQNFYRERDYDKIHSTDFSFMAKLAGVDYSYSVMMGASHQNNLQKDTTLANTNVALGSKASESFLGSAWKPSYGLNLVLPTDKEQKRNTHFRGAFGLRGTLNRSFAFLGLDILYSLSLNKNFHEFDLNADGRPLTEYSLKNRLGLDLVLTDKLSISLLFDYINGLTFRQFAREKFSANIEIGYQLTKTLSASLGVATEGNAKQANEFDSNISFFNEEVSVIHTGISLLF